MTDGGVWYLASPAHTRGLPSSTDTAVAVILLHLLGCWMGSDKWHFWVCFWLRVLGAVWEETACTLLTATAGRVGASV